MYSQGCGGSSPFFGTSKVFYNASNDGFPTAVIAERALCLEGDFPRIGRRDYPAICTMLARRQLLSAAGSIWYFPQTYRNDNSASC
jgi:hypothetical protein